MSFLIKSATENICSQEIKEINKSIDIRIICKRLELRNVKLEDTESIAHLAGNFCIADMMNGAIPHPYSLSDAESWIKKHWEDNVNSTAISWAIIKRNSETFIGSIQLRRNQSDNSARLSYWIGNEYWGNGYASEAVKAVISFGFKNMKLECIEADHFERNPISGSVLKKSGFVQSGSSRKKEGLMSREEVFLSYQLQKSSYEALAE